MYLSFCSNRRRKAIVNICDVMWWDYCDGDDRRHHHRLLFLSWSFFSVRLILLINGNPAIKSIIINVINPSIKNVSLNIGENWIVEIRRQFLKIERVSTLTSNGSEVALSRWWVFTYSLDRLTAIDRVLCICIYTHVHRRRTIGSFSSLPLVADRSVVALLGSLGSLGSLAREG